MKYFKATGLQVEDESEEEVVEEEKDFKVTLCAEEQKNSIGSQMKSQVIRSDAELLSYFGEACTSFNILGTGRELHTKLIVFF